ncbi:ATP/GTP-binding protein [Streptomyces sp. NPDC001982]|uniref:ATP/GTP-binding protein n=1 Tax=Streptomyces sp. NPDC001982 TaxID=3154405 RepID=UPI003329EAB4
MPAYASASGDPSKGSGSTDCGLYICRVEANGPTQVNGKVGSSGGAESGRGEGTDPTHCTYKRVDPQPPAESLDWEGHKPGDGAVYEQTCQYLDSTLTVDRMVWLANPPQAAVDPAVLAQRAIDTMRLAGPEIASPRAAGQYIVGVPMWMWVDQSPTTYGPNSASATAGGVTVTATAKVSKIVWTMGDGSIVICHGPGKKYSAAYGRQESPTCGHTYTATSASQPSGTYTVTATSTWTVDWQVAGGGGETGQLLESRQSQMQVAIGELQVVR